MIVHDVQVQFFSYPFRILLLRQFYEFLSSLFLCLSASRPVAGGHGVGFSFFMISDIIKIPLLRGAFWTDCFPSNISIWRREKKDWAAYPD